MCPVEIQLKQSKTAQTENAMSAKYEHIYEDKNYGKSYAESSYIVLTWAWISSSAI